jgi:hypothetical protein
MQDIGGIPARSDLILTSKWFKTSNRPALLPLASASR